MEAQTETSPAIAFRPISARSVLVGVLCSFLIAAAEPFGVGVVHGSPLAADHSTGGAVFLFFVVTLLHLLFRRCFPRHAFSKEELVVIYIMMIVACTLPSWGFVMNLIAFMAGVTYFASPENRWTEIVHPHLNWHLLLHDREAARLFYEGLKKGQSIPWSAWIPPLSCWFAFALVLYFVEMCIVSLLRKQWIENERLQFPLTQLPLEMVRGGPSTGNRPFLAQPSVWIGFAIPFIWHSLSALHRHNSLFPTLTLGWGIPLPRGAFTLSVNILFEVIGLSYLLSTDISFSLWFVALMGSLETWVLPLLGINAGKPEGGMDPGTPPVAYQGLGAMTVLVAMSVWRARSHLRRALRQAFGGVKGEADSEEAIPCRVAVWGVLAGMVFLLGWLNWSGIPLFPAAVFLLVTFVIFTGLSRVVAQAGIAYGRPPVAPNIVTLYGLGYNALGGQGLCAMGLGAAWALDVRTLVMAAAANGFKLAGASGLALRRLVPVMMLACLTALVASSWSFITLAHKYGGVTLGGWHILGLTNFQMGWLVDKLNSKPGVEPIRLAYMGLGAASFLILAFLRERFFGFPLHPVGLCLGLAGPFGWVWFSVFIAWLVKVVVMRYWGGKGYARTRPIFLGLILGSFSAAGFWWIVDAITGTQGNVFTLG